MLRIRCDTCGAPAFHENNYERKYIVCSECCLIQDGYSKELPSLAPLKGESDAERWKEFREELLSKSEIVHSLSRHELGQPKKKVSRATKKENMDTLVMEFVSWSGGVYKSEIRNLWKETRPFSNCPLPTLDQLRHSIERLEGDGKVSTRTVVQLRPGGRTKGPVTLVMGESPFSKQLVDGIAEQNRSQAQKDQDDRDMARLEELRTGPTEYQESPREKARRDMLYHREMLLRSLAKP